MKVLGLSALEARLKHDLSIIEYPLNEWVPERFTKEGERILDVLIVGGGQGGLAVAFQLMRERVNNVLVIDKAEPGKEGPWINYARMPILRSPKEVNGPDLNIPSLSFQAWYEAQFGASSWKAMGKIPTKMWMNYLVWYRGILQLPVENWVRLDAFEPYEDIQKVTLSCLRTNTIKTVFTRKIVLATGIESSGEWWSPPITETIPKQYWSHASENIDFSRLAGKRVAVLGAGASAMDNALAALTADASEVKVFCRRPELQRIQPFKWLSFPGFLRHFSELNDDWRWRFMSYLLGLREAFPRETWERANQFDGFHLETGVPWQDLSIVDEQILIETPKGQYTADFLIFGTGFIIDISRRGELRQHAGLIALWRDRYSKSKEDKNSLLLNYPYLGHGFEFLEKKPGTACWLKNIHLFTFGTTMSFGPSGSSINAMKFAVPRLVNAITKDLFFEDIDAHYKSLKAYDLPEFAMSDEDLEIAPNKPQIRRMEGNNFS